MHGNIPYMFDYWVNHVAHLLLRESAKRKYVRASSYVENGIRTFLINNLPKIVGFMRIMMRRILEKKSPLS